VVVDRNDSTRRHALSRNDIGAIDPNVTILQPSRSARGNFDGKTGMRIRNLIHYLMLTEQGQRKPDERSSRV